MVVVVVVGVAEAEAEPEDPEPDVPENTLPSPIDCAVLFGPLTTLPTLLVTLLAACPATPATPATLPRVCPTVVVSDRGLSEPPVAPFTVLLAPPAVSSEEPSGDATGARRPTCKGAAQEGSGSARGLRGTLAA